MKSIDCVSKWGMVVQTTAVAAARLCGVLRAAGYGRDTFDVGSGTVGSGSVRSGTDGSGTDGSGSDAGDDELLQLQAEIGQSYFWFDWDTLLQDLDYGNHTMISWLGDYLPFVIPYAGQSAWQLLPKMFTSWLRTEYWPACQFFKSMAPFFTSLCTSSEVSTVSHLIDSAAVVIATVKHARPPRTPRDMEDVLRAVFHPVVDLVSFHKYDDAVSRCKDICLGETTRWLSFQARTWCGGRARCFGARSAWASVMARAMIMRTYGIQKLN